MKGTLRLSFRKGDLWAIVLVLLLALLTAGVWGRKVVSDTAGTVQIYQNNQCIMEYSLFQDALIPVEGEYHNIIQISGGKVAIVESNCPGEDCVHSGWIKSTGRSLVCLPNKVEVRLVGKEDEVDFIVR